MPLANPTRDLVEQRLAQPTQQLLGLMDQLSDALDKTQKDIADAGYNNASDTSIQLWANEILNVSNDPIAPSKDAEHVQWRKAYHDNWKVGISALLTAWYANREKLLSVLR